MTAFSCSGVSTQIDGNFGSVSAFRVHQTIALLVYTEQPETLDNNKCFDHLLNLTGIGVCDVMIARVCVSQNKQRMYFVSNKLSRRSELECRVCVCV